MNRIVYVNGEYVAEDKAKVSIFDRGFLFADGVYEVSAVLNSKLIDNQYHMTRLRRSLQELNISSPADDAAIEAIQKELIKRNQLEEGIVYIQITRGPADRDFTYPNNAQPSLILFTQKKKVIDNPAATSGLTIITTADLRWARRDIKTVSLLASSMAKMEAVGRGADEAWLVDNNGNITEGSSFNAYIVTKDNTIITRHLTNDILHGITRRAVIELAKKNNIKLIERPFSVKEIYQAQEAFITAAGFFVLPIIKVNDTILGDGTPGAVTASLRKLYIEMALEQTK